MTFDWDKYYSLVDLPHYGEIYEGGSSIAPGTADMLLAANMVHAQAPDNRAGVDLLGPLAAKKGFTNDLVGIETYQYGPGRLVQSPRGDWFWQADGVLQTPKDWGIADEQNAAGFGGFLNKVLGNPLTYVGIAAAGAALLGAPSTVDLAGATAVNAESWVPTGALADGALPAAPGSGLQLVTSDAGSLFSTLKTANSVASAGNSVLKLINPSTGLTRTIDATSIIPPGWVPYTPVTPTITTTTGVNPVNLTPVTAPASGQTAATPQNIAPIDATTLSPIVVIALLAAGAFLLYGAH